MKSAGPNPVEVDWDKLLKLQFDPTAPVDRQVLEHLRRLIQTQALAPYTKLPPLREMAERWDTNYHTVHDALSQLVTEGHIILRRARGAFVAPPRRQLRRACLYHNYSSDAFVPAGEFYTSLNVRLYGLLSRRGVALVPFYDHRPFEKYHIMPLEIRQMAGAGEIDALITTEIYPHHADWLFNLEIPFAALLSKPTNRRIEVDVPKLARMVVELAVEKGRKKIGLIQRQVSADPKQVVRDELRLEVERRAAQAGLSAVSADTAGYKPVVHWEEVAGLACERLLEMEAPPDMLFIYPDAYVRGVAMALVRNGITVPEQMFVVSHRNAETTIHVPFPMTWLTVKIEDFAQALIQQVDRQILGEKLAPIHIDVAIERTEPYFS